jgi:hypothetical protein
VLFTEVGLVKRFNATKYQFESENEELTAEEMHTKKKRAETEK